jgi:hypothetical protein
VLAVTETHRSEEPIGTDTRRIGNTSGVGRVTRTIRVTKEWSRMVGLDLYERDAYAAGIIVGPNWLAIKTSIEQSLEHTYAISASRREEFAEEIGVEIEPGADVTVLTWKRIPTAPTYAVTCMNAGRTILLVRFEVGDGRWSVATVRKGKVVRRVRWAHTWSTALA